MKDILVIIDMQNDFISGSLGSEEAQAIVPKVKEKFDEYLAANKEIYFTMDTHFNNYLETLEGRNLPIPHCIFQTDGWKITPEIISEEMIENILPKGYPINIINKNGFGYPDWGIFIDRYDNKSIEVCGLCTDICVISNVLVLKSRFPEREIAVDASCCAGTSIEKHLAALEVMKSCQVEIINENKK